MSGFSYTEKRSSDDYSAYRASSDGQFEQDTLFQTVRSLLPPRENQNILDAGCGNGWLVKKLRTAHPHIFGCDLSSHLIAEARHKDPEGEYLVADMTDTLPYEEDFFDAVLTIMSLHDVSDLAKTYHSLAEVLRPGGMLIAIVANPYYSFPVGRWKRGILGRLLFRKPWLRLVSYGKYARSAERAFTWNSSVPSFFRTIPEYLKSASQAGFSLENYGDILASHDSQQFDRNYQLYHFPMMVALVFRKK